MNSPMLKHFSESFAVGLEISKFEDDFDPYESECGAEDPEFQSKVLQKIPIKR